MKERKRLSPFLLVQIRNRLIRALTSEHEHAKVSSGGREIKQIRLPTFTLWQNSLLFVICGPRERETNIDTCRHGYVLAIVQADLSKKEEASLIMSTTFKGCLVTLARGWGAGRWGGAGIQSRMHTRTVQYVCTRACCGLRLDVLVRKRCESTGFFFVAFPSCLACEQRQHIHVRVGDIGSRSLVLYSVMICFFLFVLHSFLLVKLLLVELQENDCSTIDP